MLVPSIIPDFMSWRNHRRRYRIESIEAKTSTVQYSLARFIGVYSSWDWYCDYVTKKNLLMSYITFMTVISRVADPDPNNCMDPVFKIRIRRSAKAFFFYPKWFKTSDNTHSQTISYHEKSLKHEGSPLFFVYTSIQLNNPIRRNVTDISGIFGFKFT